MIAIFTVPKAFNGEMEIIQRNAVVSWTKLTPRPAIFLLGNEDGVRNFAREIQLQHIPSVKKNAGGTPLVNDIFRLIKKNNPARASAFVNADIILTQSFISTFKVIQKKMDNFLMIGRRYDYLQVDTLAFEEHWEKKIIKKVADEGIPGEAGWIDYFIFTKNAFPNIPDFALGRTFWDKWLVWNAMQRKIPVIDATKSIFAVHQKHTYGHAGGVRRVWAGSEAKQNILKAGGWSHGATISDAPYFISAGRITKKTTIKILFGSFRNKVKAIFNLPVLFELLLYYRTRKIEQKLGSE